MSEVDQNVETVEVTETVETNETVEVVNAWAPRVLRKDVVLLNQNQQNIAHHLAGMLAERSDKTGIDVNHKQFVEQVARPLGKEKLLEEAQSFLNDLFVATHLVASDEYADWAGQSAYKEQDEFDVNINMGIVDYKDTYKRKYNRSVKPGGPNSNEERVMRTEYGTHRAQIDVRVPKLNSNRKAVTAYFGELFGEE